MIPSQTRTKLMIMVDWYTPGFKAGGQIRSIHNLVETLQDSFDIYVLTSDNDLGDRSLYAEIEKNSWLKNQGHHVIYLTSSKRSVFYLRKLIRTIQPDIIYLNSMFSLDFTIKPFLALWNNNFGVSRVILAPRGMLQKGAIQFKYFKKRMFLLLMKIIGLPSKIIFHATDENEKNDILNYFGRSVTVTTTPDFFASSQAPLKHIEKKGGFLNLIFVSRITDKKNLDYALKVLSETNPHLQIQFTIVGPVESDQYWNSCLKIIENMPAHVKVLYKGAVHPGQLNEYYHSSHLFFLPTHGENFGHVIFDSFLYGRPVLISDQTPWKNLMEEKCGSDLSLEHASFFTAFINEAASWDQNEFDEYCTAAWNYADEKLRGTNLKAIYTELFSNG